MVSRKWILILSLFGSGLSAGCGPAVTDENVRERVVTHQELEDMQAQQKRLIELGVKGLSPPGNGQTNAARQ